MTKPLTVDCAIFSSEEILRLHLLHQVASYHRTILRFTEPLRATHTFTNVCRSSLNVEVLDFIHLWPQKWSEILNSWFGLVREYFWNYMKWLLLKIYINYSLIERSINNCIHPMTTHTLPLKPQQILPRTFTLGARWKCFGRPDMAPELSFDLQIYRFHLVYSNIVFTLVLFLNSE